METPALDMMIETLRATANFSDDLGEHTDQMAEEIACLKSFPSALAGLHAGDMARMKAHIARLTNLLKAAHIALRHHTEQTRPIENTNVVIGAIDAELQGPNAEAVRPAVGGSERAKG